MTRSARLFAPLALLCSATALAQYAPAPGSSDGPDDLKSVPPSRQLLGGLSSGPASIPPAGGVPDASYRAMLNRPVVIGLRSGAAIFGTIISFEPATVTVILDATGQVVTVRRSDVMDLHAVAATTAQQPLQEIAAAPQISGAMVDAKRHFGLQFGVAPALMMDYQSGHFYGFVNGSLVFPMASAGTVLGFSLGLGASWVIGQAQRWHLDLFGYVSPASIDISSNCFDACTFVGVGAGIGMHYTWPSGFTLAWKVPVLGYAWVQHNQNNFESSASRAGQAVGLYYLSSVMGLPIFSLGYRF